MNAPAEAFRCQALAKEIAAELRTKQTPSSVAASDRPLSAADRKRRRHKVARRLYEALVAQDPNRAITLCDEAGNVLAPDIASLS
jgi:hypothetical protein